MSARYLHVEHFGSRLYDAATKDLQYFDVAQTAACKAANPGLIVVPQRNCEGLGSPVKMSLALTKLCNLRCRHCSTNATKAEPDELTTEEFRKLFDDMRSAGTFFVTFGGGEPLLRPDVIDIAASACERDLAVSIVTNGTPVTREMARALDALRLHAVTVSLDGYGATHDYIRGKNHFAEAVAGLRVLRENCHTATVAVRVTVNSRNIDEVRQLVKLAEEVAVDVIVIKPVLQLGRIMHNRSLLLKRDSYADFMADVANIESTVRVQVAHNGDSRKFFVDPDDLGCHYGREAVWVMQTGNMYPCLFFGEDYKVGNLRESGYLELWDRAKAVTRGNPVCATCTVAVRNRGGARSA